MNDKDPDGWKLFLETCKDPAGNCLEFATDVSMANPENAELLVKCLKLFMKLDKGDLAL